MKAYLITDLHFGVRNASIEWLNNQISYFDNFLINLLEGDDNILLIGGDVFDNRQSINIFVYHSVFKLFERLSKRFKEIHIIVGNHDISNKTTNDVNSLSIFNLIPNVFVYEQPEVKRFGKVDFLFMPWMNHKEHIYLQEYKADYILMHTDIASLHFNKHKESLNGVDIKTLKSFKRVFNGHIHFRQEKDNIVLLGSPYHLNRNDLDNEKMVYVLDLETDKLTKIKNTYSPEFKLIDFYNLIEYTLPETKEEFTNHYLYIKMPNSVTFDNGIQSIIESIAFTRNIKIIYYDDVETNNIDIAAYGEDISVEKIMSEYINLLTVETSTKVDIVNILNDLKKQLEN
jgi:DNA repair exonuclease SbcCD nuclease subunit